MLLFQPPVKMVGRRFQLEVYIHDGPAYAHAQRSLPSSAGEVEPLLLSVTCFFYYCLLCQSPLPMLVQRQILLAATVEGSHQTGLFPHKPRDVRPPSPISLVFEDFVV